MSRFSVEYGVAADALHVANDGSHPDRRDAMVANRDRIVISVQENVFSQDTATAVDQKVVARPIALDGFNRWIDVR